MQLDNTYEPSQIRQFSSLKHTSTQTPYTRLRHRQQKVFLGFAKEKNPFAKVGFMDLGIGVKLQTVTKNNYLTYL